MERSEINATYKWDLSELYPDEKSFLADCEKVQKMTSEIKKQEETMTKGARQLADAYTALYAVNRILRKLEEYTSRNFDLDTRNNAAQALAGKVSNLRSDLAEATYFYSNKLLSLEEETLKNWIASCPELALYQHAIWEDYRYKPHTLSDSEEKLLSQISAMTYSHGEIYSIFSDSDLQFGKIKGEDGKPVELTASTFVPLEMSSSRRVRKAAFDRMYGVLGSYKNTFATIMQGFVKERVTMAKIEKYQSAMEASTFRDNVSVDICNNLIDTVGSRLEPLYHYYDLKRRMLSLSKLHLYDIYPATIHSSMDDFSYEEAQKVVLQALAPLGKEYVETLKNGFESGWIDVFPTAGKRSGAYSSGFYDTKPYILLNWTGKFDDVSTLAHEAGHSMHSVYSIRHNSYPDHNYTIFVAEVASTVNELLLSHYLLSQVQTDDEKLFLLGQLMELFKGTLFRQTMFAEYERTIYDLVEKGETLTADCMCDSYRRLVKKYFGPKVVIDELIGNEWMRIPHFYYNFYVYKYATCISAAAAIVNRIEAEGEAYVQKYLAFLSCGSSKTPLDSLKVAEIDLTAPSVVEEAISLFENTLNQFEEILQKQKKSQI